MYNLIRNCKTPFRLTEMTKPLTTDARTHRMSFVAQSEDFRQGYESGTIWYHEGQEREGEPDEEYLMNNLMLLYEDGGFNNTSLLRWHIGFLMAMCGLPILQ